jgi:hypothetical protein
MTINSKIRTIMNMKQTLSAKDWKWRALEVARFQQRCPRYADSTKAQAQKHLSNQYFIKHVLLSPLY